MENPIKIDDLGVPLFLETPMLSLITYNYPPPPLPRIPISPPAIFSVFSLESGSKPSFVSVTGSGVERS